MGIQLVIPLLIFLLGLIIGSFLSAYTFRWPKGISVAEGRSFCPHCKSTISWRDNIPIVSFILLGAKCRNCGKPISARYPAIEFATAFLFGLLAFFYFNPSFAGSSVWVDWTGALGTLFLPVGLFIIASFIAIFVIDLENQLIPDEIVFLVFALTFSALLLTPNHSPFATLAAGFSASAFLLFLGLITRGKGMGMGDVKLALPIGSLLGWPHTITWLFMSFLLGGMVGLVLVLTKKSSFGKHIPFGPFLVVSFFIVAAFGEYFIRWLGI